MAAEWYYSKNGKELGPVSATDLKAVVKSGQLSPADMVWKKGMPQWKRAGTVKGLFSSAAASPPAESTQNATPVEPVFDLAIDPNGVSRQFPVTSGNSLSDTLSTGVATFAEVLSHPLRHAFGVLVLLIASTLSIPFLVTLVLIPVFVIGYIKYAEEVLKGQPASLGHFIGFMRHGWDSLWHLLMLLGTFFIAAAITLAPFVIAMIIAYASVGTITMVTGELGLQMPLGLEMIADEEDNEHARSVKKEFRMLATLIMAAFLSPLGAVFILVCCMAMMVARGMADVEAKYDLVYIAFERMLLIARIHWKRLLASGLWLVVLPIVGLILTTATSAFLAGIRFRLVAVWAVVVVYPLFMTAFIVYVNVFAVMTARQLVESQDRA